jgi:hypothetical protein
VSGSQAGERLGEPQVLHLASSYNTTLFVEPGKMQFHR